MNPFSGTSETSFSSPTSQTSCFETGSGSFERSMCRRTLLASQISFNWTCQCARSSCFSSVRDWLFPDDFKSSPAYFKMNLKNRFPLDRDPASLQSPQYVGARGRSESLLPQFLCPLRDRPNVFVNDPVEVGSRNFSSIPPGARLDHLRAEFARRLQVLPYICPMVALFLKIHRPRKYLIFRGLPWLRGLDLNQRPLGYEPFSNRDGSLSATNNA